MMVQSGPLHTTVLFALWTALGAGSLWPASSVEQIRQEPYGGRPALVLGNGVLELTVLEMGGALARLVLQDDPQQLNPLWDGLRADREAGRLCRISFSRCR